MQPELTNVVRRKRTVEAENENLNPHHTKKVKPSVDQEMEKKAANFSALSPSTHVPPNGFNKNSPLGAGGNRQTQTKKLVIKNLKQAPKLPADFQERSWDKLKKAVIAIQTTTSIDTSLEELYQAVENLCSHGMAEQVYCKLRELVEEHTESMVQQFLGESMDKLIFMKKMILIQQSKGFPLYLLFLLPP